MTAPAGVHGRSRNQAASACGGRVAPPRARWLISDPRGEPIDPTPRHEPGYESDAGISQPPAVIPNQDAGTGTSAPAPQSGEGTQ